MTKLHQLHDLHGQSPWLDNLTRGDLVTDRLRRLVAQGIRAATTSLLTAGRRRIGLAYAATRS